MLEEIQVVYMSVRILKFWSLIYDHNWRRYLCLSLTSILNMTQFTYMFLTHESVDAKIRNAYMLVLWSNTILRAYLLVHQKDKYENFLADLQYIYYEIKKDGEKYIQSLLDETNLMGKYMSRLNLFLGLLTCIGFGSYPLFANEKVLPFGSIVPGVNEYKTPVYEILYVYQMIVTPMGCCMYIPFTSLIVAFIMFAILMCKVLQYRLRNLKNPGDSNEVITNKLIWCIKFQKTIIRYIQTVNNLTTYIFFLEFMAFGILLCALLFLLIIVDSLAQAVIVCAYITMIFAQILALYWYANELYQETLNIAAAAYETNWFEFEIPTQKFVMLLILRAQKPCSLMVGNVHPMNLETFQSLLNVSYSYFTLLKRIYG
ncbi:odorant receptor 49b [Episyrphus balteatus]|uniref:odorant receptor 49b n=1 Tax=Episyrphus balteatus TaxID=286459 RepID=UPI002484FC51|nr:odorant receptor 49b [Episyrphus balteatus]